MDDSVHLIDIIDRLSRIEAVGAQTLEQTKKTNGKVSEHEIRINSLESVDDQQKGVNKTISVIWKVLGSLGAVAGGLALVTQWLNK